MEAMRSREHVMHIVPAAHGAQRRPLEDEFAVPGKLTALMGESGMGKTLLSVLAGRVGRVGVVGGAAADRQAGPAA